MPQSESHFLRSESGSLAPILAIMLIPMCAALGISVDYNAAIETRASMQNALDAAALSITTLPTDTTLADRQVKLQESFAANSGLYRDRQVRLQSAAFGNRAYAVGAGA